MQFVVQGLRCVWLPLAQLHFPTANHDKLFTMVIHPFKDEAKIRWTNIILVLFWEI